MQLINTQHYREWVSDGYIFCQWHPFKVVEHGFKIEGDTPTPEELLKLRTDIILGVLYYNTKSEEVYKLLK